MVVVHSTLEPAKFFRTHALSPQLSLIRPHLFYFANHVLPTFVIFTPSTYSFTPSLTAQTTARPAAGASAAVEAASVAPVVVTRASEVCA